MNSITVVIPSVGCSDLMPGLVSGLLLDERISEIAIYENRERGHAYDLLRKHNLLIDQRVRYARIIGSIYKAWNRGMDRAVARGGPESICVILNDDVILPVGACSAIAGLLWDNPDFGIMGFDHQHDSDMAFGISKTIVIHTVKGTYRHHGIGGFAFAVRAFDVPRVDEQFEWWYGDDDLVVSTLEAGLKIGVAIGIPVSHPHPETSAVHYPELAEAKARDEARFYGKWR